MAITGHRLPVNQTTQDTVRHLVWDQFPAILESGVKYFRTIPLLGPYKHFNPGIKDFKEQLLENMERAFTLSGVGSFIDHDRYGQTISRPSPQLAGTGCAANSLCMEPNCFGFTEGVYENVQKLFSVCWELQMPCLKDYYYSDRKWDYKMGRTFETYMGQPMLVSQAFQRTQLFKQAIKMVCTDESVNFTGSLVGSNNIPLPFWFNPDDPYSFPDLSAMPAGVGIGGANLDAFVKFIANRMFSGAFGGGLHKFKVYGLNTDFDVAKQQTASVTQDYVQMQILERLAGERLGRDAIGRMLDDAFSHDGMFPTFEEASDSIIDMIFQEILEPATLAGYMQTSNPKHMMANIRGLLFVPDNWNFNIVSPPKDDFSDLGLGDALNFRQNTPGVFPLLSSRMFSENRITGDGIVRVGNMIDEEGMLRESFQGIEPRAAAIREAVRTNIFLTYSALTCSGENGQLPNTGRAITPQAAADGFAMKSTMYFGTEVHGQAKPILLLFQTDQPRSARPVKPCASVDVALTATAESFVQNVCPGGQSYAVVTFQSDGGNNVPDMSTKYAVNDKVIYRVGARGASYAATVTAVSGAVVSIEADDEGVTLPACSGSPDDYGVRAQLIKLTGVVNASSPIFKALYDEGTTSLMIELLKPISSWTNNKAMTITLEDGSEIAVLATPASTSPNVFVQLELAPGETCDLADLDCNCLARAVLTVD